MDKNESCVQEITDKLLGRVWYRVRNTDHGSNQTFWYYDGKDCWYTRSNNWTLYPAEFSVAGMDAIDVYERIPDPRPK